MPPYLGGMRITSAEWLGTTALAVRFTSSWGRDYYYQLYAGRSLIGVTSSPLERQVVGQLQPTLWPQWIQLLAVDPAERDTDYGSDLPPRPYNKARVSFTASGWPADAKVIEVTAGTEPGGAVDPDNVVARELFDTNRVYRMVTEPLPGTGEFSLSVVGRDNRLSGGNVGTATPLTVNVLSQPPDVALDADDRRFSVEISGGVATVTFEVQT